MCVSVVWDVYPAVRSPVASIVNEPIHTVFFFVYLMTVKPLSDAR